MYQIGSNENPYKTLKLVGRFDIFEQMYDIVSKTLYTYLSLLLML
jgi:hypothetical protein